MAKLPSTISLDNGWVVVHGGFEPRWAFANQDPKHILRVRYIDPKTGEALPLKGKGQPTGSVYWTEKWGGPENVIYGHNVNSLENPRIDVCIPPRSYKVSPGDTYSFTTCQCVGIDTGVVFGGSLTAMILYPDDPGFYLFVQVKAKREYSPFPLDMDE
jgi:hypothetical protein